MGIDSITLNNDQLRIGRLIAEVEDLTIAVKELIKTTPQRNKTWLKPHELASLLGCSTKTVSRYRMIGKIKVGSYRKRGNRYEYHADKALIQVQNLGDHND